MFIINHSSRSSTSAYQFESVTIGKDGALVSLTCQEIEQDGIDGVETVRIALPLEVVAGGDAEAQAIAWLTSPAGSFPSAEIVADEEFEFRSRQIVMLRRVKATRNALWIGIATTSAGPVNIDMTSRDNMQGLVNMFTIAEEMGEPIATVSYTMADNTDQDFTAAEFKALALEVGLFVNAAHQRKRVLDGEIASAATVAELEAIDIDAGWPA
jgi:hypothetical protein